MAAPIYVDVKNEMLIWAIEQNGDENLNDDMRRKLDLWIGGAKKPTFNQIVDLSNATHIPLGYFFLNEPPREKIKLIEYRTINSRGLYNPSRDLMETIADMESVQGWMSSYRKRNDFEKASFVGMAANMRSADAVADGIRRYLDVPVDWYKEVRDSGSAFKYWREKLNGAAVIVMMNGVVKNNTHRALNTDEFRAFAMVDEWAPLIFINSADSSGARLFSLLHEAVHICIGVDDLFNDRQEAVNKVSETETICNAVAGELLVPTDEFLMVWDSSSKCDISDLCGEISDKFHCSEVVIARKALDSGKIALKDYRRIVSISIEMYKRSKDKRTSGGNFSNNLVSKLDRSLVGALCDSISAGVTGYTEAFRLTYTNKGTFPDVALRLGGISDW